MIRHDRSLTRAACARSHIERDRVASVRNPSALLDRDATDMAEADSAGPDVCAASIRSSLPRDSTGAWADERVEGLLVDAGLSAVRSALVFRAGEADAVAVGPRELARPSRDSELLWIDIAAKPDDAALLGPLLDRLGLGHVRDHLPSDGRAVVRFRGEALVIQVRAIIRPGDEVDSVPLLLVAAPNTVLSIHADRIPRLEEPIRVFASDPRFGRLNAGTFAGLLLDGVVDGYFGEVEEIERTIDTLDERALRERDLEPLLDELVVVRGRIAALRRTISPHQEVFAALARPADDEREASPIGWPWPGLPARLERAIDAVENAREQLVGTFDIVTTRTGERTNDVMRVLTVISAVLLPSVVIAGVMGMNFKDPIFDEPSNFLVVLAAMSGLAIAILAFARWRRWI
jgi:Mg2+ and Co2+ transporter CorA